MKSGPAPAVNLYRCHRCHVPGRWRRHPVSCGAICICPRGVAPLPYSVIRAMYSGRAGRSEFDDRRYDRSRTSCGSRLISEPQHGPARTIGKNIAPSGQINTMAEPYAPLGNLVHFCYNIFYRQHHIVLTSLSMRITSK